MHKRIGILGGMSPESTAAYYEYITRTYTERYGDYGYPEILIYVGLLGTRFTMEQSFYADALSPRGIAVLTPAGPDRAEVNRVIYDELVAGEIRDASRREFVRIIHALRDRGAQGVILGWSEIPLLVDEADAGLPLFDTTAIHAEAALRYAVQPD